MVEESAGLNMGGSSDKVLQQQYLRALSSFEGIVLSQIDIKNKLGNRLNYSIRTGLVILSVIALSIFILLLTLSSQINRISGVVANMNANFITVSEKMGAISVDMTKMETGVALLSSINQSTATLQVEMVLVAKDMASIHEALGGIGAEMQGVRGQVGNIAVSIDRMNNEVHGMGMEILRLSKPARSMNKIFPFP